MSINAALASNGSTATASATANATFSPSACINGVRHTNNTWGTGGGTLSTGGGWDAGTSPSGGSPHWLQIDFGTLRSIKELDVFTLRDSAASQTGDNTNPTLSDTFTLYGITDFKFQYWNGSSWVDVGGTSVTGNNKIWRQFTGLAFTTTKIRLYITGGLAGDARVVEVEAWTSDPPVITTTSPLPNGIVGVNFSQIAAATGGAGSLTWSKTAGTSSVSINSSTAAITETPPTSAGARTITIIATDSLGVASSPVTLTWTVIAVPTTKWSQGNYIPMSDIEAWLHYGSDISANNYIWDYSGKVRPVSSSATNAPVLTANVLNGESGWKFNGSSSIPLAYTGAVTLKHIFVVASYDDATFSTNNRGLLSDVGATAYGLLVGASGDTKFVDFNATYVATYKKNDVTFAHGSQTAAMSGAFAVYELQIPAGVTLAGIQIGKDRNNASTIWKGYFHELLAYSAVKNDLQRGQIYQYLAMRYWLWQQNADGLDVFPFFANRTRSQEMDQENFSSTPYSGDPAVLLRGNARRAFSLPMSVRREEEFLATEEFHRTHRLPTHFIYRDYRFVTARDNECWITSSLREQGSDVSFRFNYSFDAAEVG